MRAAVGQDAALVGRVLDLGMQRALAEELARGDHADRNPGGEGDLDQKRQSRRRSSSPARCAQEPPSFKWNFHRPEGNSINAEDPESAVSHFTATDPASLLRRRAKARQRLDTVERHAQPKP